MMRKTKLNTHWKLLHTPQSTWRKIANANRFKRCKKTRRMPNIYSYILIKIFTNINYSRASYMKLHELLALFFSFFPLSFYNRLASRVQIFLLSFHCVSRRVNLLKHIEDWAYAVGKKEQNEIRFSFDVERLRTSVELNRWGGNQWLLQIWSLISFVQLFFLCSIVASSSSSSFQPIQQIMCKMLQDH